MKQTVRSQAEDRRQRLLALLADGEFQSGEHLAQCLTISRGGVWKLVRALRALGVEIESLPRQGYRLPQTVDLLNQATVLASIPEDLRPLIERLDVLLNVDSTNLYLAQLDDVAVGRMQVCLAEVQQAGRGRRGRSWIAPFGSGLCISFSWRFLEAPPAFSALGLAVATAVAGALRRLGATDVGVKWPNDLLWRRRKLAGVLIEMRGESPGPAHVVIGIGINVSMPATARAAIATAQGIDVSDLAEVLEWRTPMRNRLAGLLIEEMAQMLPVFSSNGFAPFVDAWRALDVLADSKVKVTSATETVFGIARGVEPDGTLRVEVDGCTRRFSSGDVSLRSNE